MVWVSAPLTLLLGCLILASAGVIPREEEKPGSNSRIPIVGGGVTGVIAARTLREQGLNNFLIIEARNEFGGRLQGRTFGKGAKMFYVEDGANWIQGTETKGVRTNPILKLARKHDIKTKFNDYVTSITTYDQSGQVDYVDLFNKAGDDYGRLVVDAGERVAKQVVDTTSRTGYSLTGSQPRTPREQASEWFYFEFEFAQTPEQTSWIASSWANNFTFDPDMGGFSAGNLLSIDQGGFKRLIQDEANEFLGTDQVMLNSLVRNISYSTSGVNVTPASGKKISGDYLLCTLSLGVLQYGDVGFKPELPPWKQEAIQSMTMAIYTKIFLQFPEKFWFDTEFGLYADTERGKYPVWQSLDHEGFFPGSGIIFATVVGDYSKRIEALPDMQVKDEMLAILRSMFPHKTIPEPLDFHFPRWFNDPLFRGSYSNWPPSFFQGHHDNLRATVEQRLWFAGEATSQKWFGFLHGAYFEGQQVAKELSRCIQHNGCAGLQYIADVNRLS